jgi:hypothetical protein
VVRVGHAETKRLLAQDNDPARPLPDVTFETRRTLRVGGGASTWPGTARTTRPTTSTSTCRITALSCWSTSICATYQDAQAEYAAAPVIKKYTGVLAAADVYTAGTAFLILESVRLDSGVGSQVHP